MRRISYLFVLLLIAACSSVTVSKDFTFYDSMGTVFHTNSAGLEVQRKYELPKSSKIILLATLSSKEAQFQEQMSIIEELNAEKYQYMYVIANAAEEDSSGYYANKSVATELLKDGVFTVLVYDGQGKVLQESTSVISEADLERLLTKKDK